MAEENTNATSNTTAIPPLQMATGRVSYSGLSAYAGQIEEECNQDLVWPDCMTTYKAMLKDATIASACSLMEMNIGKVKWKVKIPEGYESQLKEKAQFIEACMHDMEHSWVDFIRQAATFNRFGFAPVEKVYRKRLKSEGSKYNDGLYGLRELTIISQDSIVGWEWKNNGRQLSGLWQEKNIPRGKKDKSLYSTSKEDVFIRRAKFLLFRADPLKNSPIGTSPLNNVYMAWRYKTELEKFEAIGIASDVRGLKVIEVPPQFLSKDATPEEKETAKHFQDVLNGIHKGEQSGVLLPMMYDDDKNKLFDFRVISVMGQQAHDVDAVIKRFRKEIVTGILAPSLVIGQDGSGSFALAEVLEGITATVIESRLVEIRDQLNHDLIKQLFELNGWDTTVTPMFEFEDVERTSLDEWSSAIQRIASNGLIKLDAKTINTVHSKLGLDTAYDSEDVTVDEIRENATNADSSAGEGMVSPSGQGTSKSPRARDDSTSNTEN